MAYQRITRQLAFWRRRITSQLHSCRYILPLVVVFQLSVVFLTPLLLDVHATIEPVPDSKEYLNMPWEYGEVIYRINPKSSRQLYIVGVSHRHSSTGANGSTTIAAQKEIYRIGEWLKKSTQLDLLLPEGYFNEADCSDKLGRQVAAKVGVEEFQVDNAQLERELAGEAFINAEMLLMEHLSFRACQVEDNSIYRAVRGSLDQLSNGDSRSSDFQRTIKEIHYLQEVRTAQLLQDIPEIIENQFNFGVIGKRRAMFTIGLNHIKHIFRYIENGSIDVAVTLKTDEEMPLQQSTLNLLKAGYGISIILPRSLAENVKLLEKTKIDRILLAHGNGKG